ncbi:MAG: TIGR02221 family CRISPR-associated protein [Bacteroidales bacterium]|nr:TIGR02221 family CRISPR-associated protein [Bacteroidales bacterium]
MKKFISILGTGNYSKTKYYYKNKDNYVETHFIQEATIKLLCNHFTENDRIIIFVTNDSETKNWKNEPQKKDYEGLSAVLSKMSINTEYEKATIPDGKNEDELWQIFEIIFNKINYNDELYVDITHSFRFLPMILIVLLNYAKVLKNVSIKSITYGNWEGRDDNNFSPIIDLLSLSELQDWTIAANNFVKYGNASMLVELTNKEIHPILRETKGDNQAARDIRDFSKELKVFAENIATTRGKHLYEKQPISLLSQKIQKIKNSNYILPQLKPILEHIEQKFTISNNSKLIEMCKIIDWCIEHQLYQQAYSFLIETIITKICVDNNINEFNLENRELTTSAINIFLKNIDKDKWNEKCKKNEQLVENLINYIKKNRDFYENLSKIIDLRNDFMHAGFRENSTDSIKLIETIIEFKKNLNYVN